MKRILVATDGSPGADRAVDVAAQLAAKFDADLRIVHVSEQRLSDEQMKQVRRLGLSGAEAAESLAEDILLQAERRARRLGAAKIKVQACVGDPAETLIDIIKREQADALVVGRRGRGRLAGLLLGSVSQKLAGLAPCSVIIVPQ